MKVKKTYTASNGVDGLKIFKMHHNSIDIIITDIRVPYMNGIVMVENIKAINPHVKVIYLSASNEPEILMQAMNAGADGYILKSSSVRSQIISKLFQFSKDIFRDRIIEDYHKTLKNLLNCIDNIIVLTNGKKITKVNQAFLDFLNYRDLEEFRVDNSCICDFFIEDEGFLKAKYENGRTWLDIIVDTKTAKAKLYNQKDSKPNVFLVRANILFLDDKNPIYVAEFINIDDIEQSKNINYSTTS
jgi:two-component system cell cycle response regulator